MNIQYDKKRLEDICRSNDISFLGLFGSFATGKEHPDSDVDLLVDFNQTKSLLEKGKALVELQDLFNKEVDLVSRRNVKPSLRPFIDSQIVTLYGEK